jgi:16S rRNA (guanine966-N2)-methyltransferase
LRESPDPRIRPTKARVRKSIFQRLEPWDGLAVCDLYAGIGSLGIEALSRGAAHITFVDDDSRAVALVAANLDRFEVADRFEVIQDDALAFLAGNRRLFDIVLADPPYGGISWEQLAAEVQPALAPGGRFVMELSSGAVTPPEVDTRRYGKTKVCIERKMP